MSELLILSAEDGEKNRPTKVLDSDLNVKSSFNAGFNFYFETLNYKTIHEAMEKVFPLATSFIVLGALTEFGEELEESRDSGPRRKKKGTPTIKDKIGNQIVLDLDDHILKGFDANDPAPAIREWLKEKEINCDVTWQITSSQKLNTELARIRLYFESSKELSLQHRKAWSQSPDIQADGSVYTCSQPIYTCAPLIDGGKDPIKKRSGFIKGDEPVMRIPAMEEEIIAKYSGFNRGGVEWDFDDFTLPPEVMSGSVYRRYFMPLAFHYANKLKGDRDAIFAIIASKAMMVTAREFDPENTYAYIDDALSKITTEDVEDLSELITEADIACEKITPIPTFPEDLLDSWPEPWPMLWKNFKNVPRQLEEALLVPTILATNGFFLKSSFVTGYGRRPNMMYLNLTPSTGNKDVNSKNVIRDIDLIFKEKGQVQSLFTGILNTESNITADSTFLQAFNEDEELFWINTEATRIFQQIKMAGGVSAVAALSDKLIEVVDGYEITGKVKASGKIKTIKDPNCQVLFYAQPETIERYIDEGMVDSGLFGRALLSIIPDLDFDVDSYEMFKETGGINADIDEEFVAFYTANEFNMAGFSAEKMVLKPTKKSMIILNKWAREYVAPKMASDDAFQKVLSRIGNSAEQLYCIVLGICRIYDMFNQNIPRDEISIVPLIPILEYWVDTKIYAINNFINTDLDPLAEAVLEVIRNCIGGHYKMATFYDKKVVKDYHMVAKAQIMNRLKQNTKLIRKLTADGDKRNAVVRIDQIIRTLINAGVLKTAEIKIKSSTKECIGLTR